jgi:hypothetical protein
MFCGSAAVNVIASRSPAPRWTGSVGSHSSTATKIIHEGGVVAHRCTSSGVRGVQRAVNFVQKIRQTKADKVI